MASQATNAGRDRVEVHNRLDVVVLAIRTADGNELATTMTPDDARAVAERLRAAADTGEQTPGS
jgi:hypothetical protein